MDVILSVDCASTETYDEFTHVLQFSVGLLDGGTQPGENPEAFLYLPQLVQVAVLGPALQGQLLFLLYVMEVTSRLSVSMYVI